MDEYMRDQLIVFEAISHGRSYVDGGVGTQEGSLHTKTCRWVTEQILVGQAQFDATGGCMGIGFCAGEIYEERNSVEKMIVRKNEEQDRGESDDLVDVEDGERMVPGDLVEKLEDLEIASDELEDALVLRLTKSRVWTASTQRKCPFFYPLQLRRVVRAQPVLRSLFPELIL